MNKKWIIGLIFTVGLLLLLIGSARAGGWAVLTLESWPSHVVAGEPFTIRYALRQHGQQLVVHDPEWMEPEIRAFHPESGERLKFIVQPTNEDGIYEAEMLLPQSGDWQWTINAFGLFYMPTLSVAPTTAVNNQSVTPLTNVALPTSTTHWLIIILGIGGIVGGGYLWFRQKTRYAPGLGLVGVVILLTGVVLMPTNTVKTAVAQPEVQPSAEMGQVLFQTKGCVSCHQNDKVNYQGIRTNIGPDLTNHVVTADFLRIWLRNPADVRPDTYMPNLELSDAEIESLIAFILSDEGSN